MPRKGIFGGMGGHSAPAHTPQLPLNPDTGAITRRRMSNCETPILISEWTIDSCGIDLDPGLWNSTLPR
jgi:hypothetical protein